MVTATFQKADGTYGYLVYSLFDSHGRPMVPAYLGHSFSRAIGHRLTGSAPDGFSTIFQSQIFVESPLPWSEAQRFEQIDVHSTIRQRMREAISEPAPDASAREGGEIHVNA